MNKSSSPQVMNTMDYLRVGDDCCISSSSNKGGTKMNNNNDHHDLIMLLNEYEDIVGLE